MNVNIIISMVGLFAIALLAATYFRTFGLSGPVFKGEINNNFDAGGRNLRQRLDQSEASSSWKGIIY